MKIKVVQLTNYNCPVCQIDEDHGDLNEALFFRTRSEKAILEVLVTKGYYFSVEELRTHRKHIRAAQPPEGKWEREKRLLLQDEESIKRLPPMKSLDVIEAKLNTVRAVLNELEEKGLRLSSEYNVYVRRLTELIELKEKLKGQLSDQAITIDLSGLKKKLEEKRTGVSSSASD